jgi:hypothetical protein
MSHSELNLTRFRIAPSRAQVALEKMDRSREVPAVIDYYSVSREQVTEFGHGN